MTLANVLAEDRRLVILRTLTEVPGTHLNEVVLKTALDGFGHRVATDLLRADLAWLVEHRLVRVEKIIAPSSGELWLVHLTRDGQDVAEGRHHPGVARLGAV